MNLAQLESFEYLFGDYIKDNYDYCTESGPSLDEPLDYNDTKQLAEYFFMKGLNAAK